MRSNMTIYEGGFVNTETNLDNENIQQAIVVRLYDTETSPSDNIYNILYRVSANRDGTQQVFVYWGELPDTVVAASFGYFDGSDWIDTSLDIEKNSDVLTIPEGDWDYSFLLDAVRIELGEGPTIELEMGDTPLKFITVDNDEDKFTPIRSKQVEIQVHSSDTVEISKFAEGGDNRWYVEVETEAEGIIFKGFLSISDLEQEFLPDPNQILLTATDGLHFLEDEPLVNFDGETPIGPFPIINFLAWALARTGLSLDIKACMNIREEFAVPLVSDDSGAGHFYTRIYLDAKTFESEIGECEDCLTVIQKILGENSFLTQYRGKWVILRIDEMEASFEYYFTRFNYLGEWVENTEETFIKEIGVNLPLSFMNDDTVVSLIRPYKSIIETFNYDYPQELLCNIDFSRGEVRDEPDLSAETSEGTYELDCFTKFEVDGGGLIPSDNDAYVKRTFEFGYEKDRYLVLPSGAEFEVEGVLAEPVDIHQGDKISVSVDWKLASNVGSGDGRLPVRVIYAFLDAGGGDIYFLNYTQSDVGNTDLPFWEGPFGIHSGIAVNYSWVPDTTDETQWVNISASAPPAPAAGKLYIGLFKEWQGSGVYEVDTHFANLQLDIRPQINGSYERYTGQTHTVTQDNDRIKAVRDKEVFISDAPRIAMKGALLKQGVGDNYVLSGRFYNAAKNTSGPGSEEDLMPFGQIQAFDVWNQYNRVMRAFEGTVDRTDSATEIPDLLHKYILRDISSNTTNGGDQYRIFQKLHFERDMHLCETDIFLNEVFNTAVDKNYEGHSFKYITE